MGNQIVKKVMVIPSGEPLTSLGVEHQALFNPDGSTFTGVVLDAGLIEYKFEVVAFGGVSVEESGWPAVYADENGSVDLSTIPNVFINGGEHLFAQYNPLNKNVLDLPTGMGWGSINVAVESCNEPNDNLVMNITIADSINSSVSMTTDIPIDPVVGPISSGYYGSSGEITIYASAEAVTVGSWIVTVTVRIKGFLSGTFRDTIVD